MKKRKLKRWFEDLLIFINMICIIGFASDCDDLKVFIIYHIVLLAIFIFNNYLICKYGRLFEEEI